MNKLVVFALMVLPYDDGSGASIMDFIVSRESTIEESNRKHFADVVYDALVDGLLMEMKPHGAKYPLGVHAFRIEATPAKELRDFEAKITEDYVFDASDWLKKLISV